MSTATVEPTGTLERGVSVRWRLTVVYTAVAVASAAVLLFGIYVLVSLQQRPGAFVGRLEATELPNPGTDQVFQRAIVDARESAVDNTLRDLLLWSGLGLALMAGVSVAVGWAFAGRALRPVHTITSRVRRLSADSLDERLRIEGPHDELKEMADTFDSMLDRIQEAFESERRLVATMSHELRTPLANQRAVLDVALADPSASATALREAGRVALGQTERAQRTVDALLTLARAQAGVEAPGLRPVSLDDVVRTALSSARSLPGAEGLSWDASLDAATVPADADLLERAVSNLLENAIVHNAGPDGWVRVRVVASVGTAILEVANSGPVVDAAAAGTLTLPFRRGARDRTAAAHGTGLGLTIVRAVADHHGADLRLRALDDGGLEVRLTLPLAV